MTDRAPDVVDDSAADAGVLVEDLHIRYQVYEEQKLGLRELALRGFRQRQSITVHALKGVSFRVDIGEAVGILGSNGSGKSTLLRAIAGVQPKESGRVLVRGEALLLGVSAALQPGLSGYRNVTLGGLAMGIPPDEIREMMPEIEAFAGLGEAMRRPLNTYSSGMRARLAFSVATLRVPDILLIDEALATGDREFRDRSIVRINEIREQANAVILVTHNLNEIKATCSRAIWLDQGVIRADGDVNEVIGAYTSDG